MPDKIALTPMTTELYHQYYQGYTHDLDLFLDKTAIAPYRYTSEDVEAYIRRKREKRQLVFAIMRGGRPIGEVLLKNIDPDKKVCTLSICLQNDSVKERGFGTRAERLMLDYAFHHLGMETVYANAFVTNTRSQHVLEKAGFRFTGEDDRFRYYRADKPKPQGDASPGHAPSNIGG